MPLNLLVLVCIDLLFANRFTSDELRIWDFLKQIFGSNYTVYSHLSLPVVVRSYVKNYIKPIAF